jgi:hypothetical protein
MVAPPATGEAHPPAAAEVPLAALEQAEAAVAQRGPWDLADDFSQ